MHYTTELDGFRTIRANVAVNQGQFLTIYDKIYVDDSSLYKVKRVQEDKLDLSLVKVLSLVLVEEENNYKSNTLYEHDGRLLHTDIRPSKNQTISYNNKFYVVKDIIKQQGPNTLVLEEIDFLETFNVYTIYKRTESVEKQFERIEDYGKASIRLATLRSMRDGSFYRFM